MKKDKLSSIPWSDLERAFQYEDAGMDDSINSYLVPRSKYSNDLKAKTIVVHGPAGSGKTALLIDIEMQNSKLGRRTCRKQLRSLQRLADQIMTWGEFERKDSAKYVIDFWILVEIAQELYSRLTTGQNKEIRKIAVDIGLVDKDPIETAATWIRSNVETLFDGISTVLNADPSAKALGKAAASLLQDSNVGIVTRINSASRKMAGHEYLAKLAFQIDDFDSDFADTPAYAKLLSEYLTALYDITSQGNRAPYAVAVSSAIHEYRRRQGTPLKYARKSIKIDDWNAVELWKLLEKRIEFAVGKKSVPLVANQLGLDFTDVPHAPWVYSGKDDSSFIGAIPRPRFLILLWQDLIANKSCTKKIPEKIWKSHLTVASSEIEAFLSARYKEITPLLREIADSKKSRLNDESLEKLRGKAVDSAPLGARWVTARTTDLSATMRQAGILAENPEETGKYRVRRKLLPPAG